MFKSSQKKALQHQISIKGRNYIVYVYFEPRKSSRASITKKGINIRIDERLPKQIQEEQLNKFILWAKDVLLKKGNLFEEKKREYKHNDVLSFYDTKRRLCIENTDEKKVFGKIDTEKIVAFLPKTISEEAKQTYISKLVARLLVKSYLDKIKEKVAHFNYKYQLGKVNNIRLKNNKSNWGSCSSKNNINISIRLLLAPEHVVDYVIIHELCHLKHRNHSKNFWALVKVCCPTYKESEKWLKSHGKECVI